MRHLCIFAIGALMSAVDSLAAVPENSSALMESGDFATIEQLISSPDSKITRAEADSLREVMRRIKRDFSIPYEEGIKQIQSRFSNASRQNIEDWERNNYIETKTIDGTKYMFRKSISNLDRLVPELSARKESQQVATNFSRAKFAKAAMAEADSATGLDGGHRVMLKFTIDVDADAVPDGETIRVWMPFPIESMRQKNVQLLSSSDDVTYSQSPVHNTIYMERKAEKGKAAHFEAVFAYDVYSQCFSQDYLLEHAKAYDKSSEVYKKYTADEGVQILLTDNMKALAAKIIGNETNPVKQASLIYNWIEAYFPWAGAREYSTIPNLAQYALSRGYGDCGQVSLLYITLLRSAGIPARWESGWSLEPGAVGMHDWAEVYYEGVGWVPVDMSYGLLRTNDGDDVLNFYKSGIDFYRFAANRGVNSPFSPAKQYIRSETVDSQLGEVEWKGGNLFYYESWTPRLEVVSIDEL